MYVVVAMAMTIAVNTNACGTGSAASCKSVNEGNGSPRHVVVPVDMMNRFVA